jgi:hypothetical protein
MRKVVVAFFGFSKKEKEDKAERERYEHLETPFYKLCRHQAESYGLDYVEYPDRKEFTLIFPFTEHIGKGGYVRTLINLNSRGGHYTLTSTHDKELLFEKVVPTLAYLRALLGSFFKEFFFVNGEKKVQKFLQMNEPRPGGIVTSSSTKEGLR